MKYIIDTNGIYELLALKHVPLNGVLTLDRIDIDYYKLENFLIRNLKNKKAFMSPVSIFEITNKLKDNDVELKKAFEGLEAIRKEYDYDFLCNNLGTEKNAPFVLDTIIMNDIRKNYCNAFNYKQEILDKKLVSEAKILYLFPLQIVIFYLLASHYGEEAFEKTYDSFTEAFMDKNCDVISKALEDSIYNKLYQDFCDRKEKKSFRKMFKEVLMDCSSCVLIPFDYIYDSLLDNDTPTFTLSSILDCSGDDIFKNFKSWYYSDPAKKSIFESIFNTIKMSFKVKNYSVSQYAYLKQVLIDFFSNETKMDTNDAIDFWFLGYIRKEYKLLTFDTQMIEAIKKADIENKRLIDKFLK